MKDEISIAEAMQILGVSKPTIYNHIKRGNLHPVRKALGIGIGGRRVFVSRKEVEQLRDAETPTAGPATKPAKRGGK